MTTAMLQDTVQTLPSTSGPRFRPYASQIHHVTKGRYITSNDPRGYIPVYEYPLNGQWIMMDIDDGYILWTGIWKALGNSKADIVKMIDSQPDLAPLIRRVRGGYLKIQGTWMPYEVALKLSRRVAWAIREDLIPLFGPTFPSTCLSPDQPGYGQVVPNGHGRRRARRATQNSVMQIPRGSAGWTVVTPNSSMADPLDSTRRRDPIPSMHSINLRSPDYSSTLAHPNHAPYLTHPQIHLRGHLTSEGSSQLDGHSSNASVSLENSRGAILYSRPPSSFRNPAAQGKIGLSLDIRSLSMREKSKEPKFREDIKLAPIQSPNDSDSSDSPYALPPISAMEDMRGPFKFDSSTVLRRLQMDDNEYPKSKESLGNRSWGRRHSVSMNSSVSNPVDTSPRFQPYSASRSYQDHSRYRSRSPSTVTYSSQNHLPRTDRPSWSDPSHEGDSTSNPSPTSPTTPDSLLENDDRLHSRCAMLQKPSPAFAWRLDNNWSSIHDKASESETLNIRRSSYEINSDSDSNYARRPW